MINKETIRINEMIDACSFRWLSYEDLGRCEVLFIDRFFSNLLPTDIEKYTEEEIVEYASKVLFAIADGYRNNKVHFIKPAQKVMTFVDSGVFKVEPKKLLINDIVIDRIITRDEREDSLLYLKHICKKDTECYFVNGSFVPELGEFDVNNYNNFNVLFRLAELNTTSQGGAISNPNDTTDCTLPAVLVMSGILTDYSKEISKINELNSESSLVANDGIDSINHFKRIVNGR